VLKANKGGPFGRLIDWYIGHKLKSAFRGLWVRGAVPNPTVPLLVYANHSSFWDGFVLHQLAQVGGWNAFAMMDEENLARYPFHRRMGAFSVRQHDSASALETMKYARSLLLQPRGVVCIFPQGEIRPAGTHLGALSRGLEVLARRSKAWSVPVGLRYCFFEHECPDVMVEFGTPHEPVPLSTFEASLAQTVSKVMDARSTEGFRCVVSGRRSIQEKWDAVRRLERQPHA
jgi:1-acyl-sn-glycerol-3-phosphate acyltransferase